MCFVPNTSNLYHLFGPFSILIHDTMNSDSELSELSDAPPTPGPAATPGPSPGRETGEPSKGGADVASTSVEPTPSKRGIKPKLRTKKTGGDAGTSAASGSGKRKLKVKLARPKKDDEDDEEPDDEIVPKVPAKRKRAKVAIPSDSEEEAQSSYDDEEEEQDDVPKKQKKTQPRRSNPTLKRTPVKTAARPVSASASASGSGSKPISAPDRLRASIDAARDKSFKTGSPVSAGPPKPKVAGAVTPRPGPKPPKSHDKEAKFGKTMTGWDQLFGSITGTATSSPSASSSPAPSTGATAVAGAASKNSTPRIRPQPGMERLDSQALQALREAEAQRNQDTDGCFDLLAHAEIMSAFEHEMMDDDKKTAVALRPSRFRAGLSMLT